MANHLINLNQISGGKALQDAIAAIQIAYPASKVTTTVTKDGTNMYSADDLLGYLKTAVDANNSTVIDSKIAAAVAVVQTAVDAIDNKQIKDKVKLQISSYTNLVPTFNVSDETIYSKLTTGVAYNVYDDNNLPVIDKNKANVTVTFNSDSTRVLSALPAVENKVVTTPSIVDESVTIAADGITLQLANERIVEGSVVVKDSASVLIAASNYYVNDVSGGIVFKATHTGSYKVSYQHTVTNFTYTEQATQSTLTWKVFPVGVFKFSELSNDYLLDNDELNLIYYNNALNNLTDQVAKSTDIVNEIIQTLGTTGIQNALLALTNGLNSTIATNTANITTNTNDIATNAAKIDNVLNEKNDQFAPTAITTDFSLSAVPLNKVKCYINGMLYKEGSHFTVDRTTIVSTKYTPKLTWTFTLANGGFDLDSNYDIEAYYIQDTSKTV